VAFEEAGVEFVGGPPDEEGGAEDDCAEKALVYPTYPTRLKLKIPLSDSAPPKRRRVFVRGRGQGEEDIRSCDRRPWDLYILCPLQNIGLVISL
jgi:hypothetical protein